MDDLASTQETKDHPLREDIRLLGRMLGDTVREQEGVVSAAWCFMKPHEFHARPPLTAEGPAPFRRPGIVLI